MLFATFKHHQSDFQLKVNAFVKLTLKDSPPFYRLSRPITIPITSERYLHYKEPMFLHSES